MSESLSPPSVAAEAAVVVTPASPSFWLARRVSALTPMRRDALCEAEAPPATRGVPCSVRATALGRPRGCMAAATPGLADGSLPTAPPAGQLRVASLHHVRRPLLLPGQPGAAAPPRAPRPGALVCPSTPGFRERCRPPPSGSRAFGGASREPERRSATGSAVSSRGRCSERSRAQECRPRDVSVPSTTIEALTHAQFHTKRDTFGSALGCGHRRARLAHAAQSRLRSRQMLQTQLRALRPGAGLLRARPAFLGVLGTSVTLSKGAVKPVLLEGAWWERELSSSGVPSASEWGATLV